MLYEYKPLIIIAFFTIILIMEFVFPYKKKMKKVPFFNARKLKNGVFTGINAILSPLVVLPMMYFGTEYAPWDRPDLGVLGLLLDILILDIWIYFWHRFVHKNDFMWRFHKVHHIDEEMDVTNALRFHFGEVLISSVARLPVVLVFSISFEHVLVFETCVFCAAMFHHSNMRCPEFLQNFLRCFLVTPEHHWVHHHPAKNDLNSNFSTIFVWWDYLFKTLSKTHRKKGMKIGLPSESDKGLTDLILMPFKR